MKWFFLGSGYPCLTIGIGLVPRYNRKYFSLIPSRYYSVSDGDIEMFGIRSTWLWITYYRELK